MASPDTRWDDRIVGLDVAISNEIRHAQFEHKRLAGQELSLLNAFIHNECFERVGSYEELIHKFRATKPLIDRAIHNFARRREEGRNHHERYTNGLRQQMRNMQVYTLPEAMRTGRRQLLFDAAAKMEDTMCLENGRTRGEKVVATSVLFRYPELRHVRLITDMRESNEPPTTMADKRRYASYLLVAELEKERCVAYTDLRHHFEMLFQWTWGRSIEAVSKVTDDECIADCAPHHPEYSPSHEEAASEPAVDRTLDKERGRPYTLPWSNGFKETQDEGSPGPSRDSFACTETESSSALPSLSITQNTDEATDAEDSHSGSVQAAESTTTEEHAQPMSRTDSKLDTPEEESAV